MQHPKAVSLVGTCNHCGESVEVIITKRQVKAILKGFKAVSPAQAEIRAEKIMGRDEKGELKP